MKVLVLIHKFTKKTVPEPLPTSQNLNVHLFDIFSKIIFFPYCHTHLQLQINTGRQVILINKEV